MNMESDENTLQQEWEKVEYRIIKLTKKKPDLNAVLFLIGIHELGKGSAKFSKEEKQDLMHIATCRVLSYSGYYELEGLDQDGWPHWKSLKPVPKLSLEEQEKFLKAHIIEYFSHLEE